MNSQSPQADPYRVLFEEAPLPMWIVDAASLGFLAVNDAAIARYGFTREEFLAMRVSDLHAPDEETNGRCTIGQPGRDTAARCHRRKDGSLLDVEVVTRAITFEGRAGRLAIVKDLTAEREIALALRASEEQMRAQFMAMPVPTYAWRALRDDDFELIGYNHAAFEFTKGRVGEWVGRCASTMFAGTSLDYARWMRECLATNRAITRDIAHRLLATGEPRDFVVTFVPIAPDQVLVHTMDETERRAAERELRASEERFRMLIENGTELVSVIDAEGVYQYASATYGTLLGHDPATLVGTVGLALVHEDDLALATAELRNVLRRPGEICTLTTLVRHRDGEYRHFEFTAQNLLTHPAIRGIVCNGRDVTERRELEARLRQSQKLEAVGQLAAGVAHDFNNLLTALSANLQFAAELLPPRSPVHLEITDAKAAVTRAATLTQQLLAFSRKQSLRPQPVDLNSVVANLQRMLVRLIGEDITLSTELHESLGTVHADPGQLDQVLMNLVVNARDAMPRGGTVVVRTANVAFAAPTAMGPDTIEPGNYVLLEVRDTGHGMDRATLARLFEPFFTTKGVGRGTGLGLATVYGIVRQSEGYMRALSEPGKGATFEIYLPRTGARPVAAERKSSSSSNAGAERVLLVEDEDTVRTVARRILAQFGYTVHEARNGREALTLVRTLGGAIDLVITDMVMPQMDGRELMEALRRELPRLPVLFMSGYTEDDMVRRGAAPGTRFLPKPFTAEALGVAVRFVLENDDAGK